MSLSENSVFFERHVSCIFFFSKVILMQYRENLYILSSGTDLQVDSNTGEGCVGFSEKAFDLCNTLVDVIFSRRKRYGF